MQEAAVVEKKNKETPASSTFVIKVMYTENATIQGYVQWLEEDRAIAFRSALELLHLMEEALKKGRKELINFRSWDN